MARTRALKPDFFEDTTLANCDPLARLLYVGLWCWLDGQCLVTAEPRIHRKNIFPFDESITSDQVKTWIDQLVDQGRLIRFSFEGKELLFCPKLKVHSRVYDDEPKKFNVPESLLEDLLSGARVPRRTARDMCGTYAHDVEAEAEAEVEVEVEEKKEDAKNFDFEKIYGEFPRRVGTRKGEGIRALEVQSGSWTQKDFEECILAAKNYRARCKLEGTPESFILHFKTWCGSVDNPKWREWIHWQPPPDSGVSDSELLSTRDSHPEKIRMIGEAISQVFEGCPPPEISRLIPLMLLRCDLDEQSVIKHLTDLWQSDKADLNKNPRAISYLTVAIKNRFQLEDRRMA